MSILGVAKCTGLLLLHIYLLTAEISGQAVSDFPIYLNPSSIKIDPSTVSCGSTSGNNASSCHLIDGDLNSSWMIPRDNVSITLSFSNESAIVSRVRLHHSITSTSGLHVVIILTGSRASWVTYIAQDCKDFSQSTTEKATFYNCIEFSESASSTVYTINHNGQFSFEGANGSFVWWESFTQIKIQFRFTNISQTEMNGIFLKELEVFGWNEPTSSCNCHPVGVLDPKAPCDENGDCVCNLFDDNGPDQHCVPTIRSFVPYGPIDGGTLLQLSVNVNSSAETNVMIGDSNSCTLLVRSSSDLICNTTRADPSQLYQSLPLQICWTTSYYGVICKQFSERFQYRPTPVINSVEPRATFTYGGIRQTVRGENLDSVFQPRPSINVVNVGKVYRRNPSGYYMLCVVTSPDEMICPTPVVDADIANVPTLIEAYLEIFLDHGKYSNATNFSSKEKEMLLMNIFGKVTFKDFGTKNYDPKSKPVTRFSLETNTDVQLLLRGARPDDYSITVGNVAARNVSVPYNNIMFFTPPAEEPPTHPTDKDGAKLLKVQVGFYSWSAGYIKYGGTTNIPLIVGLCVGLGGAALLAALLAAAIVCIRRKRWPLKKPPSNEEQNIYDESRFSCVPTPTRSSSDTLIALLPRDLQPKVRMRLIDFSRLSQNKAVGKGNFGEVYRGTLSNLDGSTEVVAIKTLKGSVQDRQTMESHLAGLSGINLEDKVKFLEEATMMIEFSHKNVLSLKAIAIDNNSMPYVVLPFMEYGDLKTYISNKNNNLSVAMLLKFGLQVSEGMEYLTQKKYIHRDLAARNCMIDRNLVVKVADFGLARDVFEGDYYRPVNHNRPLPIKWMAIESLSEKEFSVHSDVWSYGVLLWELVTRGKKPYPNVDMDFMQSHLRQGNRLPKPDLAPDAVYKLMRDCWNENPSERPTFTDLKEQLSKILAASGHEGNVVTREPENMLTPENTTVTRRSTAAVNSYLELSAPQAKSNDYLTTDTPGPPDSDE